MKQSKKGTQWNNIQAHQSHSGGKGRLTNLWYTQSTKETEGTQYKNYTCSRQKKRQRNIMTITPIHLQVQAKKEQIYNQIA